MSVEKTVENLLGIFTFHKGVDKRLLRVGNMLKTDGFLSKYF
jgi:hypothetical protein